MNHWIWITFLYALYNANFLLKISPHYGYHWDKILLKGIFFEAKIILVKDTFGEAMHAHACLQDFGRVLPPPPR